MLHAFLAMCQSMELSEQNSPIQKKNKRKATRLVSDAVVLRGAPSTPGKSAPGPRVVLTVRMCTSRALIALEIAGGLWMVV